MVAGLSPKPGSRLTSAVWNGPSKTSFRYGVNYLKTIQLLALEEANIPDEKREESYFDDGGMAGVEPSFDFGAFGPESLVRQP